MGTLAPPWRIELQTLRRQRSIIPFNYEGIFIDLVPSEGLEPTRPEGREFLGLRCLPFHQPGILFFYYEQIMYRDNVTRVNPILRLINNILWWG